METFTLIVWLYAGLRYEEVRVPGLGRDECTKQLRAVESSRFLAFHQKETGRKDAKGKCVGANGTVEPRAFPVQQCSDCGVPRDKGPNRPT